MTTSSTTTSGLGSVLSGLTNSTTGTSSISGSGPIGSLVTAGQISVSTLVSELMTIQEQPLTQLQKQESGIQSKLSAYGQIQSALSSLQGAAQTLSKPSSFQATTASVTGSGVSAVVTGTPFQASYSLAVSNLASAQSVASAPVSSSAAASMGTGTLTIQLGQYSAASNAFSAQNGASAITVNITSGNNSLSGIAAAINSASNGAVNASVVGDGSGNSRLVLTSANTGAANGFSVAATGSLGALAYDPTGNTPSGMTQTQSATDASFSINGLALTSSTNSVSSAIAGVTLNLTQGPAAGGSPLQSQVTIGTDTSAIDSNINNFVSAYNAFVTQAGSLTNYNASTKTASELTGDPTTNAIVHSMQTILGGSTSGGSGALSYLAQVGITFTSAGTLSVNTTTLNAAIQSNPTGVANLFGGLAGSTSGQGLALQVSNMAQQMLDSGGMLGVTEQGLNSQLTYLKTRATMMQQNLTQTQNALLQEYSALNAAVTAGQAQQVQIANEMANLPG